MIGDQNKKFFDSFQSGILESIEQLRNNYTEMHNNIKELVEYRHIYSLNLLSGNNKN